MSFTDKQRPTSSKITSSTLNQTSNSYLRKANSAKLTFNDSTISQQQSRKDDILSKEEEYKRLNAELEKKTATLVYEAEQVLKANERLLEDAGGLEKFSDFDFLRDERLEKKTKSEKSNNLNLFDDKELNLFKKKIHKLENEEKDNQYEEKDENDDLLSKLISNKDNLESNLIPKVANEMSNEAQIRFLKAKLKVLQEEIERLGGEVNKREEENLKLAQRCKELDEDRAKQLRISNSHQTQMEKFKKLNEELQVKLNQQEIQLQSLKKENEQFKRDSKKSVQDQQQQELRLNRALEECDKYKQQLHKVQSTNKESNEQEKKRVEQLQTENKRLEKQKNELILAFKKQLKLIDVLKRQKMHLEASRMLQFTEEEFINALELNSSNQQVSMNNKNDKGKRPSSGLPPTSANRTANRMAIKKPIQNINNKNLNISKSESDINKNDSNAKNSQENLNNNYDDDLAGYGRNFANDDEDNQEEFVLNDISENKYKLDENEYDEKDNYNNNDSYNYFNKIGDELNDDDDD